MLSKITRAPTISKIGLRPAAAGVTDSGGSAHVFPKREYPFWHDDLPGCLPRGDE